MILLVDDKPENLFSLKSLLQIHGYETDTAPSGEEALKKVLKQDYELIILDVQMPGMDGYEVAEAIGSLSKTRDIPIIFLTAVNIDKRFIAKGYKSGGVEYVTKPFDPELLLLKVKTFNRLYEQQRDLKMIQEVLRNEAEIRKKAQHELERLNLSLEETVEARTKELLLLNQGLENRNAELAQYVSLASHDLQEPVRKIITFCRILDDKYLEKMPEAHRDMQKVIASAERMRTLINDLLNYSKLSADTPFETVDLNEIVASTLADLEVMVDESNAVVLVQPLPSIDAIPGQMRQLFQNMISNAIKFSKKNTMPTIEIWAEFLERLSMEAAPLKTGPFVRIHVKDDGIGFDEAYLDKIFTIFQRLHGRSDYEGTGIGLAIVKKIVEKHHGLIGARSLEDNGATFSIVLPVKQKSSLNNNNA